MNTVKHILQISMILLNLFIGLGGSNQINQTEEKYYLENSRIIRTLNLHPFELHRRQHLYNNFQTNMLCCQNDNIKY